VGPEIYDVIQSLFEEYPSPLPGQAPAIEAHVMLRGGKEVNGSLSEFEPAEGVRCLRMLVPTDSPDQMVELFFSYDAVLVVAVKRTVTAERPRIII
jgi:hypothetical protein